MDANQFSKKLEIYFEPKPGSETERFICLIRNFMPRVGRTIDYATAYNKITARTWYRVPTWEDVYPVVETSIQSEKKENPAHGRHVCKDCFGTGWVSDNFCKTCEGEGQSKDPSNNKFMEYVNADNIIDTITGIFREKAMPKNNRPKASGDVVR